MVVTIPSFIQSLESQLRMPLPGQEAQKKMAPSHRKYPTPWKNREDATPSAVLILLFPRNNEWFFILTERSNHVEYHQGQISLPGGAQEAGEGLQQTALRETQEELGFDVSEVSILGKLTPLFIFVSGFLVHPFVGWMSSEPKLNLDSFEVESVHFISLGQLLNQENIKEEYWLFRGEKIKVPFFHFNKLKVWGATATILSEFREIAIRAEENSSIILDS